MLSDSPRLNHPERPKRAASTGGVAGGILFGIASPLVPALETQWPTWLSPVNGAYRSASIRAPSSRRSD